MTVTLITGTSSGIGLATAVHLAGRGHRVYASMRDLARSDGLREAAVAEGVEVELVELDVDEEDSVRRAVDGVLEREGHVDVLVNNAGIAPFNPIERASEDEVKGVFETNLFGALRLIRAVLPSMRERRAGTIVNVSSVAGRVAAPCMGVYSASKFALEAASESLAREVHPHGVRVVIIEPGIIPTPIIDKAVGNLSSDENAPYATVERRTRVMFEQGKEAGGDPRHVAEAIEEALADEEPRLRYLVGADADVFMAGRLGMSDEEWIAMDRHASDEDYFQEFAVRFPMPA